MSTEVQAPAAHLPSSMDEVAGPPPSVLITAALATRTSRAPDYEAENRALTALMQESAVSSANPLQSVVETALDLCRAHSAGISLLEQRGAERVFVWRAITGAWSHFRDATMPRENSPCGSVLDRDRPMLMSHPERWYPMPPEFWPLPVEVLLVPLHVEGRAVGTVWIASHDDWRKFDREDLRVVEKLSQFAALAFQRRQAEKALAEVARIKDVLYRLADRLNRTVSLEDVYSASLQAIIDAMQCSRASILLFDGGDKMRFVASSGLSERYRAAVDGHSPWLQGALNPEPICINDIEASELTRDLKAVIRDEGIGALAFIPLVVNDRLIGKFMAYFDAPHAFHREEIDLGIAIARQLAFGIDRKRSETQARRNARQLALVTDTAPVYIAHCDTQARFKFVNKGYARRLGLDPKDCVGKRIEDVVGKPAYEAFREYVDIVLSGRPVEFEVTVPYASGGRFMHCSYVPEHDSRGEIVGFVAAITDITERKHIEESLRQSEESLKEADRRKNEFLAMLAHELRNPLAPIRNAAQILSVSCGENPAARSTLSMLDRQISQMVRLVDDLLDVSRVSRGKIELRKEHVEINSIVRDTVEAARALDDCKQQKLHLSMADESIYAHADPTRLAQIIGNLINNACKFNCDSGTIWVTLEAQGPHAVIRVRDTGVGIAADQFARIFELFAQVDTSIERSQSGLGIGLTLVKTLTEMHGGTVAVESAGVNQGSEFIIRLPRLLEAPQATAEQSDIEPAVEIPRRILVVDDNRDSAVSLATLLELYGHQTRTAFDGVEALDTAKEFRPDVILLDIGLPRLNGYEVAQRLRAEAWGKDVVLVALTGWGEETSRQRSSESGIDAHLVKPVEHEALLQLVRESSAKKA
jgi:PAS domain S-box-containing protein